MGGGGLKGRPGAPHQILWLLSPAAAGMGPATAGNTIRALPYCPAAAGKSKALFDPAFESFVGYFELVDDVDMLRTFLLALTTLRTAARICAAA